MHQLSERLRTAEEAHPAPFCFLKTKLEPPRSDDALVARPRLVESLDEGLKRPLTLVHAPAGFGKSTLLRQWLAQRETAAAWLWLEEEDNHFTRFVAYLVAAVQRVFPDSCQQTRSLLCFPITVPASFLTTTLLNELTALPHPLVLVLEEYEAIDSDAIHELLGKLVEYQSPQLHLVVVTRVRPPFPLPRLRERRAVNEIGIDDLRFTFEETEALLAQITESAVNEATVAQLYGATEGWVGGLHLAMVAGDATQLLREFFVREVMARQPGNVRDLLVESAILERFCPSLLAAVVSGVSSVADAERMLEQLQSSSLFINRLEKPVGWYRHHHLFREALLRELQNRGADEIADLHRRAAIWLEAQGEIDLALSHWLAAGEEQTAADLVEKQVDRALVTESFHQLAGWLELLPSSMRLSRPRLLLADVWVRQARLLLPDTEPQLDLVENLLDCCPQDVPPALAAEIAGLRTNFWYWRGDAAHSQAAARDACRQLPAVGSFAAAYALARGVMSRQLSGTAEDALCRLDVALQHPGLEPGARAQLLLARALVHFGDGTLREAERSAQGLYRLAERHGLAASASWARYLLGRINYEWNRLEEAVTYFSAVVEAPEGAAAVPFHDSHLALALIYELKGESDLADELVVAIQECFWDRGAFFLPDSVSFQARQALLRGEMGVATRLVEQLAPEKGATGLMLLETASLTRVRILLAQNTPDSLEAAMDGVRALLRISQATHNRVRHAELLALRALVLAAKGETGTALDTLRQALAIAERGGLVRIFLDLGPPMAAQLYRLAMNGHASGYARQLLAAFPRLSQPALVSEEQRDAAVEPLTDREWEVLDLIGRRLSNKEIANDLVISPHTVKKHASNIYQKLGVNNRREAISRAHQLGLLPTLDERAPYLAFA